MHGVTVKLVCIKGNVYFIPGVGKQVLRRERDMRMRAAPQRALWSLLCASVGWLGATYTLHALATARATARATAHETARATQAAAHRAGYLDLPCLILTSNASGLDPSTASCTPFNAAPFTARELGFVSAEARRKLANPSLLQRASDLTNNASVNIYMNHARMWSLIAEQHRVALVLEDDVIVNGGSFELIRKLLSNLRKDNATNFVLKLHDSSTAYHQWREVFSVSGHTVRACDCRPSQHSASAAAYLMDQAAAKTLLQHAYPASMHVDVYMHEMGCIQQKIRLYGTNPYPMTTTNRLSTHMPWNSAQRSFLLLKEKIENTLFATC
jgi:hypothetical protein